MSETSRFSRAVAALTPDARAALQRALRRAIGEQSSEHEVLAADLVNTDVEHMSVPLDEVQQRRLITRAGRLGERAPIVGLSESELHALLVSPAHIWTLVDRVDELEVALSILAVACVRELGERGAMQSLLAELDA